MEVFKPCNHELYSRRMVLGGSSYNQRLAAKCSQGYTFAPMVYMGALAAWCALCNPMLPAPQPATRANPLIVLGPEGIAHPMGSTRGIGCYWSVTRASRVLPIGTTTLGYGQSRVINRRLVADRMPHYAQRAPVGWLGIDRAPRVAG